MSMPNYPPRMDPAHHEPYDRTMFFNEMMPLGRPLSRSTMKLLVPRTGLGTGSFEDKTKVYKYVQRTVFGAFQLIYSDPLDARQAFLTSPLQTTMTQPISGIPL